MCSRRLSLGAFVAAALLLGAGAVSAQLPKEQQKCIDQYNNKLRLVSQQAGKSARSCIKNATKDGSDPNTCVVTNSDGKVAGKQQKVTDLYTAGKCTGDEPIQQGAATGNAVHEDAIIDLAHAMFGDPIGAFGTDKVDGKCVDKAFQRSTQAFTEIVKNHRKCVKDGMKGGAITGASSLDATCGTLAQMDPGGKAGAKLSKLGADVSAACASTTTPLGTLFDGLDPACTGSAAALGTCLQTETKCSACITLSKAGFQVLDCDVFDNGASDASCPNPIGAHACTMNAGGGSNLAITTQALPLSVNPSGVIDIRCGYEDSASGTAPCACDVDAFDPVVIPGIGDVCVNPFAGCSAGTVDCDGGAALDVDVKGDHNVGACTSNDGCATACDAHCAGFGPNYKRISSGCEAFCDGGDNDEASCANDTDCPGGTCVGNNPPGHAGTCNCVCGGTGLGGASAAGSLSCNVGVQIDVELPTDGDCLDANTIVLPPQCGAVTTTQATGNITDANNSVAKNLTAYGAPATGTAVSCAALGSSTTAGLKLVGSLGFFDSTLGDIHSGNTFQCN